MQIQPKTEAEVEAERPGPWTPGEYDFEVIAATEKKSKTSGKDMIEVELNVFNAEGKTKIVRDYLMEAMSYKLRHFAHGVGLGDAYDGGYLDANDCVGRGGKVKLKIEKDKSGQYPDKNAVADYVVPATKPAAAPAPQGPRPRPAPVAASQHVGEEDIPF